VGEACTKLVKKDIILTVRARELLGFIVDGYKVGDILVDVFDLGFLRPVRIEIPHFAAYSDDLLFCYVLSRR
jgi:hypothetical protein